MRVVFIHLNPVSSQLIAWQGEIDFQTGWGHVACEATAWPWQTFPSEHLRCSCKSSICSRLATVLSPVSTLLLPNSNLGISPHFALPFCTSVSLLLCPQVPSSLSFCAAAASLFIQGHWQPSGLTLVPQWLFQVPYLQSIKAIISLMLFKNGGMTLLFLTINITYGIHWKNEALYYTIMPNTPKDTWDTP